MINWTIKIARPILTEGMFFQVRYRKVDSQDWIPFSPNPTTNEFTITALEDDTNYEAEIRTICLNGELSRPVYYQLKEGDRKDDDPISPTPQPQPTLKISWYDEDRDFLTQDTEDKTGEANDISVGTEQPIGFEKKDPNSQKWVKVGTSMRKTLIANVAITAVGTTEIRGFDTNEQGQRYYSNILRYTKIEPTPPQEPPEDPNPQPSCRRHKITIRPRETAAFSYIDCQGKEIIETIHGDEDDRVYDEIYIFALEGTIRGNVSYEIEDN